jgi:hypothetical protein
MVVPSEGVNVAHCWCFWKLLRLRRMLLERESAAAGDGATVKLWGRIRCQHVLDLGSCVIPNIEDDSTSIIFSKRLLLINAGSTEACNQVFWFLWRTSRPSHWR